MTEGGKQQVNIHEEALDAIEHWDALPAWRIYRELETVSKSGSPGQQNTQLMRDLLVVAFPALPREQAVTLFRDHFLDFFRADVDLEERLSARYTYVGYSEKDAERKVLKEAILQNKEPLGLLAISEWLRLFDKRFDPETRPENASSLFITQATEVGALSKVEQSVLREILRVYDQYLVTDVLDVYDMAVLYSKGAKFQNSSREEGPYASRGANVAYQEQRQREGERRETGKREQLALLQAMGKYPLLGQQMVTEAKLKIKNQPELQRPSLTNWIRYYRDELGVGFHDQVQRAHFLFQSENGEHLSEEERERLNLILKSIEEELPLEIDSVHQAINFPSPSRKPIEIPRPSPVLWRREGVSQPTFSRRETPKAFPQSASTPVYGEKRISSSLSTVPTSLSPSRALEGEHPMSVKRGEESLEKHPFLREFGGNPPGKNIAGETLHFSTGHVLPAERDSAPKLPVKPTPSFPVSPSRIQEKNNQPEVSTIKPAPRPAPPRSPYSIRPLRFRNDPEEE